jgi:hypothetical protein
VFTVSKLICYGQGVTVAWIKSFLAGIAAVICVVGIAAFAMAAHLLWLTHKFNDSSGGYFVVTHWHGLPTLCALLVVFAAGFWWERRWAR